jgi:hypothetical protein
MRQLRNYGDKLIIAVLVVLLHAEISAQTTKHDSIWLPLKVFVGNWQGKGGGEPGNGEYERTYQFVLNKKFIEIRNKSTYPPSEKNPNGEVHEDVGYISYDKARRTFVLRQFHIEGFVNQYTLQSISDDGKKLMFASEAIENIPAGWRAKETYDIIDENQIQETFELAQPNKDFEVYSKVILHRIK